MTHYFSIFIPIFCLLSRCFFFLLCPGIHAIRVHTAPSPRSWCYLPHDMWTNAALLYHPVSNCLVKTGFPLFSAVRSHKEWPDRGLREASVLYFNILICLYCLYYTMVKKDLSAALMHYRCRRNTLGGISTVVLWIWLFPSIFR